MQCVAVPRLSIYLERLATPRLICSGVGMTESNFYTDKTLYFMHMKVLCEREGANDLFNESG